MRAQTTLDFAIGISVFLVALASVFAFVPRMLQPFEDSAPETTTFGNRIGNQLVGGTLVEPGEEPVLDVSCTVEGDYDGDGTAATLCWDGDTDRIVEEPAGDCDPGTAGDVLLDIGTHDPPARTGTVVVARRVVALAGHDATLEVRAW